MNLFGKQDYKTGKSMRQRVGTQADPEGVTPREQ